MTSKNPFWGLKCTDCDQIYTSDYFNDPFYTLSSCYETLFGKKMFTCGKCKEEGIQEQKANRQLKKGVGRPNENLL